jgi:hypothetical protein
MTSERCEDRAIPRGAGDADVLVTDDPPRSEREMIADAERDGQRTLLHFDALVVL